MINQKTEQTAVDGAIRSAGIISLNYLTNKMGMKTPSQGMRYLKWAGIVIVNAFAMQWAKGKTWYPKV